MSNSERLPVPLPNDALPPLPPFGATGPHVCEIVRLYLAIIADLTPEQVAIVQEHVRICDKCAKVQRLLQRATGLFTSLPASMPSNRVDQAIMATISSRSRRHQPEQLPGQQSALKQAETTTPFFTPGLGTDSMQAKRRMPFARKPLAFSLAVVAAAAMLLIVLRITLPLLSGTGPSNIQSFHLPAKLSWSGYVLYHSETRIDTTGEHYQINTYHNLGTDTMHVETVMAGSLDVVAVSDPHETLGLDMMHHVAQWGVRGWSVDETPFDLPELRTDLATNNATYLDTDMFHGQPVYRIRCRNGLVLLLDMNYKPVNVLRGAVGQGTGEPIYDTLTLMPQTMVASSMWNMSVPAGFTMGTLPQRP